MAVSPFIQARLMPTRQLALQNCQHQRYIGARVIRSDLGEMPPMAETEPETSRRTRTGDSNANWWDRFVAWSKGVGETFSARLSG